MPPQFIDSDSEPEVVNETKKSTRAAADEDMEDEELEEEEYIVEAIKDHKWRAKQLLFLVKWKGYDEPTDLTWEPEDNCSGAQEILEEYFKSIGGRPVYSASGTKRGRPSGTPQTEKQQKKRGRTSASASVDTPTNNKRAASVDNWKPSEKEDWEKVVEAIDTVEKNTTGLVCYLHWKNGKKSQHPIEVVYKKCPQKMLRFYEQHLVFKQSETEGDIKGDESE